MPLDGDGPLHRPDGLPSLAPFWVQPWRTARTAPGDAVGGPIPWGGGD